MENQPSTISPVTLSDGTRLYLLRDGEALHAAYSAIERANRRICVEVYIFHSDATGHAFADLLSAKARAGLGVHVIYDAFGSWDSSGDIFDKMRASGVKLREFHPLNPWATPFRWRPLNRDHRKMLVIDNDVAGLGGLNIGAEYAGSSIVKSETLQPWRDNGVGIVGPGATALLHAFAGTWKYLHGGGRIGRAQFIHNIDEGELGVLASVPTVRSPLRPFLGKLFRSARRAIDLTMAYFAPDDALVAELCHAADRGARVRLMLPGRSDLRTLQFAARSFYETLLASGVEIYERQDAVLHAKTMTIDDCVSVVGSTNLDYRSIEYNCEISAVIRNAEFGARMRSLFEDDKRLSRQITLDKWRYRPTRDRLLQWAVSRARYLL